MPALRIKIVFLGLAAGLLAISWQKNMAFLPNYWRDALADMRLSGERGEFGGISPGAEAAPLAQFLKGQSAAGYYTDAFGPDFWYTSPAQGVYQGAQYALAPVTLDWSRPSGYRSLVLACRHSGCGNIWFSRRGYSEVARSGRYVLAVRQEGVRP